MITLAAIQLTSTDSMDENASAIATLVEQAKQAGASFVALPENAYFMRREARSGEVLPPQMHYTMQNHPAILHASELAKAHLLWLLVGSIAVVEDAVQKPYNRSLLFNPNGELAAHYDKIHLFDVTLPDGQEYRESARMREGSLPKVSQAAGFMLGFSICYDVRFPEHFRALSKQGAQVLAVPSAFTVPTGKAHWEVLLRARAIENGAYVIAPAQVGTHAGGRETYGHSLIINPWGDILAQAGQGPCVITARIDLAQVEKVRKGLGIL